MSPSRRTVLLSLSLLPAWAGAQAPVKVEGRVFAGSVELAGARLVLNGTGVRAVAWFTGYAAGLYLAARASTAAQAVSLPGPKRLQLQMLHTVPAVEFTKALRKGVARNSTSAQLAQIGDRMERFAGQIDAVGKVRKHDVVDLDFDPARGLLFSINGKLQGEPIVGDALFAGLLRAFLGEQPYDEKMRAGLLGGRA
jgi:Chalcone isomerase-like